MSFRVEWTTRALDDLDRLFDFIVERELAREDGDLSLAVRALVAVREATATLQRSPATCRKATDDGSIRELVVPFGASGYLLLFDMKLEGRVRVIAVRHQREDGYGE
jgi:plasmid stabilization system protein ParE